MYDNNPQLLFPIFLMSKIIAFSTICLTFLLSTAAEERHPNVIIIFTDDQGYGDVGVFGAKGYETPNLDRMAAEGRKFTQWYASQPVC